MDVIKQNFDFAWTYSFIGSFYIYKQKKNFVRGARARTMFYFFLI